MRKAIVENSGFQIGKKSKITKTTSVVGTYQSAISGFAFLKIKALGD
jgi:hypothetical protein